MTNRTDYNRQVIEEFRANGGKVSGPFESLVAHLLMPADWSVKLIGRYKKWAAFWREDQIGAKKAPN